MCAGAELAHFMPVNAAFYLFISSVKEPSAAQFQPAHRNSQPN